MVMGADFYERQASPVRNKISHGASSEKIPLGIGEGSVIEKAIIDKNARIGQRVIIKNIKGIRNLDRSNYYIRDGIVIVPKNALIPDYTVI